MTPQAAADQRLPRPNLRRQMAFPALQKTIPPGPYRDDLGIHYIYPESPVLSNLVPVTFSPFFLRSPFLRCHLFSVLFSVPTARNPKCEGKSAKRPSEIGSRPREAVGVACTAAENNYTVRRCCGGILSDANCEGQIQAVLRVLHDEVRREFWRYLNLAFLNFEDVGLAPEGFIT